MPPGFPLLPFQPMRTLRSVITLRASDIDSTTVTFSVVSGPNHGSFGSVSLSSCTRGANGDGTLGSSCTATVIYTPAVNYNGDDSFIYKANDSDRDSNLATALITILPVNDAPLAHGQTVVTNEDTPATIVLNATDIDSQNLTFSIVTNAEQGYSRHDLCAELCSQWNRCDLQCHGCLCSGNGSKWCRYLCV